jgi:hypothetical protein
MKSMMSTRGRWQTGALVVTLAATGMLGANPAQVPLQDQQQPLDERV